MLDGMMVANTDVPATNLEVGLTPGLPTLVSTELPCEAILKVTLSVRDNKQLKELQKLTVYCTQLVSRDAKCT